MRTQAVGGVELSERLLRLAKRVLWVICPLYACVKGRSDGTGWDGNLGGCSPEVSVSVSSFSLPSGFSQLIILSANLPLVAYVNPQSEADNLREI